MADLIPKEEYWLSGPVEAVPDLLQPIAHALLQARVEINAALTAADSDKIWDGPNGLASVGFHLKHIAGVLDRLFTYAKGEALTEDQLRYLSFESQRVNGQTIQDLLSRLFGQIDKSIEYLKSVDTGTLTDTRAVGRKKLPSTVLGLLFHAAEHTMRHCGQLLVTARVGGA